VFTSRFPYPLERGDKLRIYHQIRVLSRHFDVYLFALSDREVPPSHWAQVEQYCRQIRLYPIPKAQRLWNIVKATLQGLPLQVGYFYDADVASKMREDVERIEPDILYFHLARMAPYAHHFIHPKILDYMDAFGWGMRHRRYRLPLWQQLLYVLESKWMEHYEAAIFERFDAHTIISQQDRERLSLPPPQRRSIVIVPNGVDIFFFQPYMGLQRQYDLCFVGNLGYPPNIHAARYLVKRILPLLRRKSNRTWKVLLAGARPHRQVQQLASTHIIVSGWLDDIRHAYATSRIFVAPLFTGTGLQNKILEAMAMGIPCITSTTVNNAIGAVDGENILLANTAEEFVNKILLLQHDATLYKRLSERARQFVEQRYSWEHKTQPLIDLINRLWRRSHSS